MQLTHKTMLDLLQVKKNRVFFWLAVFETLRFYSVGSADVCGCCMIINVPLICLVAFFP